MDPDCLEKFILTADHLNIAKKQIFVSVHFYSFVFVSWKQNLTWIRIESDPNPELITAPDTTLQIISDPAGSECTTLGLLLLGFPDPNSSSFFISIIPYS